MEWIRYEKKLQSNVRQMLRKDDLMSNWKGLNIW